MALELHLIDDQYPPQTYREHRLIARGLVMDDRGRLALHEVKRDDAFGKATYFETPGGGVEKGESLEQALVRECREELGYEVEIIKEIGVVFDAYNLIGRLNENHYFLAKRGHFIGCHFVSSGDSLIHRTIYLPLEEAIAAIEGEPETRISHLVRARELPIFKALEEETKLASVTFQMAE